MVDCKNHKESISKIDYKLILEQAVEVSSTVKRKINLYHYINNSKKIKKNNMYRTDTKEKFFSSTNSFKKEFCIILVKTIALTVENKSLKKDLLAAQLKNKISNNINLVNEKEKPKINEGIYSVKTKLLKGEISRMKSNEKSLLQILKENTKKLKNLKEKVSIANLNRLEKENEGMGKQLSLLNHHVKGESNKNSIKKQKIKNLREETARLEAERVKNERNVFSLLKFLGEKETKDEENLTKHFCVERRKIDEIISLHKKEILGYEAAIVRKENEVEKLYDKIASQDGTIREMGTNLLSCASETDEEELKKELSKAKKEVLKLKSELSERDECYKKKPGNLSSALDKGFMVEKDFYKLQSKYNDLEKELEKKKKELVKTRKKTKKVNHSLKLLGEASKQRTDFYRSMTHLILENFHRSSDSLDTATKEKALKEMYELVFNCENKEVVTPRLKRIVRSFSDRSLSSEK